jgi:cellulose synthase/poly-beta-1,6-N-acetylglucosamine synthase-like glycosyltransferase
LPATKRDIGFENANGEILAFLDDDAYPVSDWLKQAVLNFNDDSVACVCGPAVTPENEPLLNKASGLVFESFIVSGPARFRYIPLKKRFTDDFPSCNFFIRKEIFKELGGFKTRFWPGEDTILCLEVVHKLNKKIIYDPLVLVYHHRRCLFAKHLKQVANYALHRGYFLKRYPETSFKLGYFAPSVITFALFFSLLWAIFLEQKFFYIWLSYFLIVFIFSFNKDIKLFFYVFMGIILTHFIYGINFIKGILAKKLKEEL